MIPQLALRSLLVPRVEPSMTTDECNSTTLLFDEFSLNVRTLELRKHGMRVRLRHQPSQVLAVLASRPGELVTREELQREVWGAETFVDFQRGLNNCIKQIRQSLNDNPDTPRYVETIPRKGYRFIASVAAANGHDRHAGVVGTIAPPQVTSGPPASLAGEPIRSLKVRRIPLVWVAAFAAAFVSS